MRPSSRLLLLRTAPLLLISLVPACESSGSPPSEVGVTKNPKASDVPIAHASPRANESVPSAPSSRGPSSSASVASSSSAASASASAKASPTLPATDFLCDGDRFAQVLDANGDVKKVDCALAAKRCVAGACVPRICTPGALSCDEGNVVRCNTGGSALLAEKTCRPDAICSSDTRQPGRAVTPAACVTSCPTTRMNLVMAMYDCSACDWSHEPFCKQRGPATTCSESLCQAGALGFGVSESQCARVTEGLLVPGTRKLGACKAIAGRSEGIRTVDEEVCGNGAAVPRTRFESCAP